MPAVALTDHGSLAGAVELYKRATKAGIKPLLGCEVYLADDRKQQTKGYAHLTLLAESNEGYANLIRLSSLGYLEGYYYKPRVDWELLAAHAQGVIALSGCLSGRVCKALEHGNAGEAESELARLEDVFGPDSVYVELQNAGLEVQRRIVPAPAGAAGQTGLRPPLRAVPDPRPQDDARPRHRLLRARARPRDQLRGREVRPRPRRADHHVRDDDGPRRRPRRPARPRDPARPRRT